MKSIKDLIHPEKNKPLTNYSIAVDDVGIISLGMNNLPVECPIKNRTVEAAQTERRITIQGQDAIMLQVTNVPRCNSICRAFNFKESETNYEIGCAMMDDVIIIEK